MNILLDTHVWLWWVSNPSRIKSETLNLISNPDNSIYLSAASALEIAIKVRLGKLQIPDPIFQFVFSRMKRDNILELPITINHSLFVSTLPPHHRDPFDRLLVAQAVCEGLTLLTADEKILRYDGDIADVRH